MQEESEKRFNRKAKVLCFQVKKLSGELLWKTAARGERRWKMEVQEGSEAGAERRAGYIYFKNPFLFLFLKIIWDQKCMLPP